MISLEFNEKLQELRKNKGLTQEELANALFVSRTAVSKWESGRGYPSIDSLREISRFFSVTIDELICPDEIISAAENEKKEFISRNTSLVFGLLDVFMAVLLLMPVFGNGAGSFESVPLYSLTGINAWIKAVFTVVVAVAAVNGIFGVIVSNSDKPLLSRRIIISGAIISIAGCTVFLLTRQPYAGMICFAVLVIKGFLLLRRK